MVLCRGELLGLDTLPPAVSRPGAAPDSLTFAVGTPLKSVERAMIESTLESVGGDKALAAQLLGITARTIYRREAEWRGEGPDD